MLERIRRDPGLRSLPIWLIAAPIFASAIEGVRTLRGLQAVRAGTEDPLNMPFLVLAVWLPLSVFLLVGKTRQRCRRFDLGLPVPARELWLSHMFAVVLSGGLVLVGAACVIALRDAMVSRLPGRPPVPEPGIVHVLLPVAAVWLLALAVLQSPWPKLYRIPLGKFLVVGASIGLTGGFGLVMVLASVSPAWSLIPLVLALLVVLHNYRNIPSAFTLFPFDAEPGETRPASRLTRHGATADGWAVERRRVPGSGFAAAWSRHALVMRVLTTGELHGLFVLPAGNLIMTLLSAPLFLLWGFFIAGGFIGEEDLWVSFIILTSYLIFAFLIGPAQRLYLLDPLPISRRTIFAWLMLPGLVTLSLGVVAGRIVLTARESGDAAVQFQQKESRHFPPWPTKVAALRIPMEYCEISRGGQVPEIASPWGESHEPWKIPLYKGSGTFLYSPFAPRGEASPEFIALQLSRAIDAVYGESISPADAGERYLEIDEDGAPDLRDEGAELRHDIAAFERPERIPIEPLLMSTIAAIFFLAAAVFFQAFRAHLSHGFRKGVWIVLLVGLLALHLLFMGLVIAGVIEPWTPTALFKIFIRHTVGSGLGGTTVVWLLAAALFALSYAFTLRRFQRIEVPLSPAKAED